MSNKNVTNLFHHYHRCGVVLNYKRQKQQEEEEEVDGKLVRLPRF